MASRVDVFTPGMIHGVRRAGRLGLILLMAAITAVSLTGAFHLRFEFQPAAEDWRALAITLPVLMMLRGVSFLVFGLHLRPLRHASAADLAPAFLAVASASAAFFLTVKGLAPGLYYSRAVILMDCALTELMVLGLYLGGIVYREAYATRRSDRRRALVAGDGPALLEVLRQMNSSERWLPVGVVCAETAGVGEKLLGVGVRGRFEDTVRMARETGADVVCFANPGVGRGRLLSLTRECRREGLPFVALQNRRTVRDGAAPEADDIGIEALLQREEVSIDLDAVRRLVRGHRVLVTGAGGSIGSELSRQLAALQPAALYLIDRCENSLFFIRHEIVEAHPDLELHPILLDITDELAVADRIGEIRPQVVFHAAAYKHVGMMERQPSEAIRNNVAGTYNVALASARSGALRFINISTDKAVRPESYMGLSKRLAEHTIAEMCELYPTRFATVRFGNVAGSAGSVIQIFRQQIERGGPVTVTDPRARRYFMSIPEAVRLVLQATVFADLGGTFVLDMGEPIEIHELARTMIALSGFLPGVDIPIEFTRLAPGEKLHEELNDDREELVETAHPRIRRIRAIGRFNGAAILSQVPAWQRMLARRETAAVMAQIDRIWSLRSRAAARTAQMDPADGAVVNGAPGNASLR